MVRDNYGQINAMTMKVKVCTYFQGLYKHIFVYMFFPNLYNSIHIWHGMCTSNIKIFCLTLKFHEVCFASNLTPTFNPYLIPKHYVTKQNIRLNVKYEDLFFLNGNPLSPNVLVGKSSMCPSICRSSA